MEIINKKDGRDFSSAILLQMENKIDRNSVQALIDNNGYNFATSVYNYMQEERGIFPTLKGLDDAFNLLNREEQLRCFRVFNNLIRQDYY